MVNRVAEPSLKSLYIEMLANGNFLASGTAFICNSSNKNFLVTNWHNLSGRNPITGETLSPTCGIPDAIRVSFCGPRVGTWVEETIPLFDDAGARWIEHPTLGCHADIAALPLSEIQSIRCYPYYLESNFPSNFFLPTLKVSVVGFPFGIRSGGSFPVWASGYVATEPEVDHDGRPVFLIDSRTRKGQSGSPVILYRDGGAFREGEVFIHGGGGSSLLLGIYSGRVHKDSDLGIVWKVSAIQELLSAYET